MSFLKRKVKILANRFFALDPRQAQRKPFANIRDAARLSRTDAELTCKLFCESVYLGENTVLCRILTNYLFFADASDIGLTPHMCLNGYWESWITQVFCRQIKTGDFCVDIGANQGYFSILMAALAGQNGKLLAIEPNPKPAYFLRKNLEVNGFPFMSTVVNKAVSEAYGQKVKLFVPGGRDLNASIYANSESDGDYILEVETTTIDQLTKDWQKVDFIKIDAEGAEELIWEGMKETIAKNKQLKLVVEFRCGRYENPERFLRKILDAGFSLAHIDYDSEIKHISLEQCLNDRPDEDWMLFLERK